jgi:ABC-type multidrug transport system fused ATPase/permease subunit
VGTGVVTALRILLDSRQRWQLVFAMAGMMAAAAIEMVSIAGIPAFVLLLTMPDRFFSLVPGWLVPAGAAEADAGMVTMVAAAALATVFLVKNAYLAAQIHAEGRVIRDITVSVSHRLFHAYLYSPYTFHLQRNPSQLISNIFSEVYQAMNMVRSSMHILRESLVLVVALVLLLLVDPFVSLSVFALLGIAASAFYLSVRTSLLHRGEMAQHHRERQLQAITQGIGAIKDARILGVEPHLLRQFDREVIGLGNSQLYQQVVSAVPRLFLEVIAMFSVLLVATVYVASGRPVEGILPVLALLAVAAVRLVPAFNAITSAMTHIRYGRPSMQVVSSELQLLEAYAIEAARARPEPGHALRSSIRVRDLSYRYPGAVSDSLNGVSLDIAAGEAVAFIGATGAGKSTLLNVILGLLTPRDGAVLIDECDMQSMLAGWQRQIGYVAQDIYLTDDTIRRNIAFGLPDDEIDEAALETAVRTARLEDFVRAQPDGLDTRVGDRGARLSGGERQRVGIARALYHDPAVLVFDEATSALDHETEQAVVEAISRLRGDRTIIMIAHRLTTVRSCDRLFLLEDGRLKDQGDFAALALRHAHLRRSAAAYPQASA